MAGPVTTVSRIANHQQTNRVEKLPNDVLLFILSSLPPVNVAAYCCISKDSNRVASDQGLWKGLICQYGGSYAVSLFSPLVNKGIITWKEAWCYRSLPSFLSKAFERRYWSSRLLPVGIDNSNTPTSFLKQPIVIHQGASFVIMNSSNIEKQGQKEVSYRGKLGTLLTNLSHDGTCIWAYRRDGILIQWNPSTGESRKIQTRYALKDPSIEKALITGCAQLLAQDGFVIILYTNSYHVPLYEIIDLKLNKSFLIKDRENRFNAHFAMQVHDKRLYRMQGRYCFIRNLETHVEEPHFFASGLAPDERIFGLNFYKNQIYIISDKSKFEIITPGAKCSYRKQLEIPADVTNGTTLGHLFLKYDNVFQDSTNLMIMNFKTEQTETVSVFEKKQFRPECFEEIVKICKANDPLEMTMNESSHSEQGPSYWDEAYKAASLVYAWFTNS